MTVRTFENFEEMVDFMAANRRTADSNIQDWQREIKPGDFVVRVYSEDLLIFGEILDIIEIEKQYYDLDDEEQAEEFSFTEEHYREGGNWHGSYRFGRFYSIMCPEGELGDIHLSTIFGKIPHEVFEACMEKGWDIDEVAQDLVDAWVCPEE